MAHFGSDPVMGHAAERQPHHTVLSAIKKRILFAARRGQPQPLNI